MPSPAAAAMYSITSTTSPTSLRHRHRHHHHHHHHHQSPYAQHYHSHHCPPPHPQIYQQQQQHQQQQQKHLSRYFVLSRLDDSNGIPLPTLTRSSMDCAVVAKQIPTIYDDRDDSDDRQMIARTESVLPQRDSHDLSLPARQVTRDSLVTSMLLSLDQMENCPPGISACTFVPGLHTGPFAAPSTASDDISRVSRPPFYAHSYSSDLESTGELSRVSSQTSRDRQNQSTSGFHGRLNRIKSLRETRTSRTPSSRTPSRSRRPHSRANSSASYIDTHEGRTSILAATGPAAPEDASMPRGRHNTSGSLTSTDPARSHSRGAVHGHSRGDGGSTIAHAPYRNRASRSFSLDDHGNSRRRTASLERVNNTGGANQPSDHSFLTYDHTATRSVHQHKSFVPSASATVSTTISPGQFFPSKAASRNAKDVHRPWILGLSKDLFNTEYYARFSPLTPVAPHTFPHAPGGLVPVAKDASLSQSHPSLLGPEDEGEVGHYNDDQLHVTGRPSENATARWHASTSSNPKPDNSVTTPPAHAPSVSGLMDSAPAPHVGFGKSRAAKTAHSATNSNNHNKHIPTLLPAPQAKAKPGFFRRIFTSSSSKNGKQTPSSGQPVLDSSLNEYASTPSATAAASTTTATAAIAAGVVAAHATPDDVGPTTSASSVVPAAFRPESEALSSHHAPVALQKKTSTLVFRRCKRSIPDAADRTPPLPHLHLPGLTNLDAASESTPSLRRAMDPYLTTPEASGSEPASAAYNAPPPATSGAGLVHGHRGEPDPAPKPPSSHAGPTPASHPPVAMRGGSFFDEHSDSEDAHEHPSYRENTPTVSLTIRLLNHKHNQQQPQQHQTRNHQPSTTSSATQTTALPCPNTSAPPVSPVTALAAGMAGPSSDLVLRNLAGLPPSIDEPDIVLADPFHEDQARARKIFEGNEDLVSKDKAAAWMGEEGPVRQRTLRAYMDLFDFTSQSILTSLRILCGRLVLRAETQQVDRILVAFAKRWCHCNPNHGFKATDVIHTICYSIMLLNTDLHMADIEQKMTRSQFVKNTMTTIMHCLEDSAPQSFERPSILPVVEGESCRLSTDQQNHSRPGRYRVSAKLPPRADSALSGVSDITTTAPTTTTSPSPGADPYGPLVNAPFDGPLKGWAQQIEAVLKDIYTSIRQEHLPLFGAEIEPLPTSLGLSVRGMLKRSPSVLSKTPSENLSLLSTSRGRLHDAARNSASRWTSKSRSRQRAFGSSGYMSSRTSFEDGGSLFSPTEASSATWSRYSLGRTQTSTSVDSFSCRGAMAGSPRVDLPAIGFANALSQALIRDDQATSSSTDDLKQPTGPLFEDESLALAGPPWVKEGLVSHKHHLDGEGKRAKNRNWTEVFTVIQKGEVCLFSFASSSKSLRYKRSRYGGLGSATPGKGAVVGGGNWQDSATSLGSFSLRQALSSELPTAGYSRVRPHMWALSLPDGAVHLFQVGTPEIGKEFVTTANYWAARLSTHPLVGGISNIEYGWSNSIVNAVPAETTAAPLSAGRPGSSAGASTHHRTSLHCVGSIRSGSIEFVRPSSRSSMVLGSHTVGNFTNPSRLAKLPGDRIHIANWTPPSHSMRSSTLSEGDQLNSLLAYVEDVERELQAHNALRSPMLLAYSPRSSNLTISLANWQRKSEYLLRESVRFRTYVDCLRHAEARKAIIYRERETVRRAAFGTDDDLSCSSGEGRSNLPLSPTTPTKGPYHHHNWLDVGGRDDDSSYNGDQNRTDRAGGANKSDELPKHDSVDAHHGGPASLVN